MGVILRRILATYNA